MIELITILSIIALSIIGYVCSFFDFYQMFNASYSTLVVFTIFARGFLAITENRLLNSKKRTLMEALLFVLVIECLLSLYFYYFTVAEYRIIKHIVFTLCLTCLVLLKIYQFTGRYCPYLLFQKKDNYQFSRVKYGPKYKFWQTIDLLLMLFAVVCSYYIDFRETNLYVSLLISLPIICIGLVNLHIRRAKAYWIALEEFKDQIKLLILKNEIDQIAYPPIKDLKDDYVFSRCVVILNKSTFRILEVRKLTFIVQKILLKEGYIFEKAHEIASGFLGVLNNNLMRRKYDDKFIPSFIINSLYKIKRKKK